MFESKISCDHADCFNELNLNSSHPSDSEIEIEGIGDSAGGWLIDYDNGSHYCPSHALECANELGLEYSSR